MWRASSLKKTLMLGKIEGRRRRGQQRMVGWYHWLSGHEFEQTLGDSEGQGSLVCCSLESQRIRHDWATEQQQVRYGRAPVPSNVDSFLLTSLVLVPSASSNEELLRLSHTHRPMSSWQKILAESSFTHFQQMCRAETVKGKYVH